MISTMYAEHNQGLECTCTETYNSFLKKITPYNVFIFDAKNRKYDKLAPHLMNFQARVFQNLFLASILLAHSCF